MSESTVLFLLNSCPTVRDQVVETLACFDTEVRHFTDREQLLEILREVQPAVLVLQWTFNDLDAIDFLIRISENKSWGSMRVYFIHDREITESEQLHMATLGAERTFSRAGILDGTLAQEFVDAVATACDTSKG